MPSLYTHRHRSSESSMFSVDSSWRSPLSDQVDDLNSTESSPWWNHFSDIARIQPDFSSHCPKSSSGISSPVAMCTIKASESHGLSQFLSHSDRINRSLGALPAANVAPPEILLGIFYMLSPRDFENARKTCSQWMRVSLDKHLLEAMLKRAGWWDTWQQDCQFSRSLCTTDGTRVEEEQSVEWRMSRRFATECLLSGRKINVEKTGFITTEVMDFSRLLSELPSFKRGSFSRPSSTVGLQLLQHQEGLTACGTSKFIVSGCGNYLLATVGCMVFLYRLLPQKRSHYMPSSLDAHVALLSSFSCPTEIISATIDTSTTTFVVAAILRGRLGIICDLDASSLDDVPSAYSPNVNATDSQLTILSQHVYRDICSVNDPPRSISLCPGRRCVAFGSGSGIEIHWYDEKVQQDCRKHFPMSQPSEVLHFLPHRRDAPMELRLVSSLAGPGLPGCQCQHLSPSPDRPACQFHLLSDVHSLTRWTPRISTKSNLSLVRATHCHHYRAIPVNDGLHILFIEPRTGMLCIGSDAPVGGPTSLTRAMICVPPPLPGQDIQDPAKEEQVPTVFAAGSNLNWGLRIVAAYQDRIVLFSVPLDVFNVIRRERERQGDGVMGDSDLARDWFLDSERHFKRRESLAQNQSGDWEFLLSVSYRPTAMMWPLKIYGKEIGRMDQIVELSLQASSGGARVWAFNALGTAHIIDVDTFSSPSLPTGDIPCKSFTIGSDGRICAAALVDRAEAGLVPSPYNLFAPPPSSSSSLSHSSSRPPSRKRKQSDAMHADFGGSCSGAAPLQLQKAMLEALYSQPISSHPAPAHAPTSMSAERSRRPSFAACIVDFKIPELGLREGHWLESTSA